MPSIKNKLRKGKFKPGRPKKNKGPSRKKGRPSVIDREPKSDRERNDLRLLFEIVERRDSARANGQPVPSLRSIVFDVIAASADRNRNLISSKVFQHLTDRRKIEATYARVRRLWAAKYGRW